MDSITSFFNELITQHRSIDIAESEFRRILDDDEELQADYKSWCEENGYTEKRGFREYCEDYLDALYSVWDNLKDYDE